MSEQEDWRAIAVFLYEVVQCASQFSDPPACFGTTRMAMATRLSEVSAAMRLNGLDKNFLDLVRQTGIPVCDHCYTFDCVVGRKLCQEAADAGFLRVPVTRHEND